MARHRKQLSPEQEAEALRLKEKLQAAMQDELLDIARTLVSKQEHEIFGDTEFEVRDLLHRGGAKMFQEHLHQKKTATSARESNARIANKQPPFTGTGPNP
jgi:hypothetical protein